LDFELQWFAVSRDEQVGRLALDAERRHGRRLQAPVELDSPELDKEVSRLDPGLESSRLHVPRVDLESRGAARLRDVPPGGRMTAMLLSEYRMVMNP
jgi:hypothetical protein